MPAHNLIPRKPSAKVRPHIVRKPLKTGDRYYVYSWRGGPLVMKRDEFRPTLKEAIEASWSAYDAAMVDQVRPRPRFIQQIIDIGETGRWTYFIGCRSSAIKIGAAGCVKSRLKILQAHSPLKIKVLAKVQSGESLEGAYHSWFAEHRLHNEWFAPHPDILAEIARLQAQGEK